MNLSTSGRSASNIDGATDFMRYGSIALRRAVGELLNAPQARQPNILPEMTCPPLA
jgi:hypothetical protein